LDIDPTLPNQEDALQVMPSDDESDEYSVVNLVSERLAQAIRAVPQELLDLTEGELKSRVNPTQTEYQLRVSFWREFENVFTKGRKKIISREVFGGICTEGHFYRILGDPGKVAWLVKPMEAYDKQIEAIQVRLLDRLWKLSEMELEDPKKPGVISTKRVDIFLKVFDRVSARKRAMVVKHMPAPKGQKQLLPSSSTTPKQVVPSSIRDIRARIAELDAVVVSPAAVPPSSQPSASESGVLSGSGVGVVGSSEVEVF
jgi:hypothetical protein